MNSTNSPLIREIHLPNFEIHWRQLLGLGKYSAANLCVWSVDEATSMKSQAFFCPKAQTKNEDYCPCQSYKVQMTAFLDQKEITKK